MSIKKNLRAIDKNVNSILQQLKEIIADAGGFIDVDGSGDDMYCYVYWDDILAERKIRAIWLGDDDVISFYAPEYWPSSINEMEVYDSIEVWSLDISDALYETPTIINIAEVIAQYTH